MGKVVMEAGSALFAPDPVDRAISRHGSHPCPRLASLIIKESGLAPDLAEDFLGHIFGVLHIVEDAIDGAKDVGSHFRYKGLKTGPILLNDSVEERVIVECV